MSEKPFKPDESKYKEEWHEPVPEQPEVFEKPSNPFKDASDQIAAEQKAEEVGEREMADGDKYQYEAERRLDYWKRRNEQLDKVVPDRKCPNCGQIKPKSKQWIVRGMGRRIICRSCWDMRAQKSAGHCGARVFSSPELRVKVNSTALMIAREMTGLSQEGFGMRCGWSRGWQAKLENGRVKTVGNDTMEAIIEVLERGDVSTDDPDILDLLSEVL